MESGKPFTIIRDAAKSNSYFHVISDKKIFGYEREDTQKFAGHAD